MANDEKNGLRHEMSEVIVPVPTVIIREIKFGKTLFPSIFIVWFGEADSENMPKNAQFFFGTGYSPFSRIWLQDVESFEVVFIGKIKDWPEPEFIDSLIEMANGSSDTLISWLMSSKGEFGGPSSIMAHIVVLEDPDLGLIVPRLYCDLSVRDRIMKTA